MNDKSGRFLRPFLIIGYSLLCDIESYDFQSADSLGRIRNVSAFDDKNRPIFMKCWAVIGHLRLLLLTK